MTAVLEYVGVYKAFDAPVLRGIDFRVDRGERVAVVGPSGGGKSVLLKMAIGLVRPDAGDVRLDGRSVVTSSRRELERLRNKAAYLFQTAALFDSMTVYENVALGIPADTLRSLDADEVLRRVSGALDSVRLAPPDVLWKMPSELSGGMRKRVGLARATIGERELMLFDEPVTGLDPVTSAAVSYFIARCATGVTAVLVTHDVEGALELVDRIALLDAGRILFDGSTDEFRSSQDPLVRAFADRRAARLVALQRLERT